MDQANPEILDLDAAQRIARGVAREFGFFGWVSLYEVSLKNGRRADILSLGPKGELAIVEVKSSLADFRADSKWPEYLDFCDRFYFAVAEDFPMEVLPEEQGLIIADAYSAHVLREAPEERVAAARRKALTLMFAQAAGRRLLRQIHPRIED